MPAQTQAEEAQEGEEVMDWQSVFIMLVVLMAIIGVIAWLTERNGK